MPKTPSGQKKTGVTQTVSRNPSRSRGETPDNQRKTGHLREASGPSKRPTRDERGHLRVNDNQTVRETELPDVTDASANRIKRIPEPGEEV